MEAEPLLRLPHNGSKWVWELDKMHARVIVEVLKVQWDGEVWWVTTRSLPDAPTPMSQGPFNDYPGYLDDPKEAVNSLDRFWDACRFSCIGGRYTDLSNPISEEQYKGAARLAKEEHHLHRS